MADGIVIIINMATQSQHIFLSHLIWLFLILHVLNSIFEFNTEKLLYHILWTARHVFITWCLKRLLECRQKGWVTFLGILLLVVSVVVSLIKLREDSAHYLHKLHRSKWFSLEVQISEELLSCLSHYSIAIHAHLSALEILECIFKFVNSLKTLHHWVHIAGVA